MITKTDNIPKELKKLKQWCVFKIEPPRKEGQHKGKIPINPISGKGASSADSNTWVDFKTASSALKQNSDYDGLGFFFNNNYIGIDLDDIPKEIEHFKKDPSNPNNAINWLNKLINNSYLELSQSGEGIHIIVKGKYPYSKNRKDSYEIYGKKRFFALTGNVLNNQKQIKDISKKNLKELYTSTVGKNDHHPPVENKDSIPQGNNLSIDEIINKMYASSSGVKIKHLMDGDISDFNSQSQADLALCDCLAFWTGKDATKMDEIFRQSKLMRSKWDEKRGASTYGEITINKAIEDTTETFNSPVRDAPNFNFEWNNNTRKKYPNWVYFDKSNNPHVSPQKLGTFLLNKNKNKWLLVQDDDKNEFWIYKFITLENHSVEFWQIDNIKNLKGYIHTELVSVNLWSSRAENDTYKFIVSALQAKIKPKKLTVGSEKNNLVPFTNGVFDIKEGKTLPHSPENYFTDCAPYPISKDENKRASLTNQWFKETFRENTITVKEYIGYMFFNTYAMFQAFMILKGHGGEGKTTITNYIASLLPESWVFNASLEALTKSEKNSTNFNIAELQGKYLDLNQDISDDYIQDPSKIKNLTGWDWLTAQTKGKQKQSKFKNYAKLLFACNNLPKSFDVSNGMIRRLYIIDAFAIKGFNDKYDMKEILKERGSFVRECIQACLNRYKYETQNNIANPQLTLTDSINFYRNKWLTDNSVVRRWASECIIPPRDLKELNWTKQKKNRGVKETYNAFVKWCKDNNEPKIPSKTRFNDSLQEMGYHHRRMHFSKTDNIDRWENFALNQDTGDTSIVWNTNKR